MADELAAKYGRDLTNGGTIFVGDKGYMYCDEYCGGAPDRARGEAPGSSRRRRRNTPRTRGIHADFLRAVKEGGDPPCSNFPDVSGPYLEALLVGNLASWPAAGKKVEWDGANMKLHQYARAESVRPPRDTAKGGRSRLK